MHIYHLHAPTHCLSLHLAFLRDHMLCGASDCQHWACLTSNPAYTQHQHARGCATMWIQPAAVPCCAMHAALCVLCHAVPSMLCAACCAVQHAGGGIAGRGREGTKNGGIPITARITLQHVEQLAVGIKDGNKGAFSVWESLLHQKRCDGSKWVGFQGNTENTHVSEYRVWTKILTIPLRLKLPERCIFQSPSHGHLPNFPIFPNCPQFPSIFAKTGGPRRIIGLRLCMLSLWGQPHS